MRYYHILVLGLFTLFTSCRMYEDMPSGDNYVSTAIAKDTQSLRQLLRSSEHGWMLTLVLDGAVRWAQPQPQVHLRQRGHDLLRRVADSCYLQLPLLSEWWGTLDL